MTFKERYLQENTLLLERDLIEKLAKKAKGVYYDIKGEPGLNDFRGKNKDFIDKGDEIILSPTTHTRGLAPMLPSYTNEALGGKDRTLGNLINATQEAQSKLWDKTKDPSIAKEQEEILSAMMEQPVRYSERFYDKDFNEPMKSLSQVQMKDAWKSINLAEKLEKSSEIHHLNNKLKAATMNIDELTPQERMNMYNAGMNANEIAEKLNSLDFI